MALPIAVSIILKFDYCCLTLRLSCFRPDLELQTVLNKRTKTWKIIYNFGRVVFFAVFHGIQKAALFRITVDGIRGDEWFKGYEGKIPSIEENRGSVVSVSAEDIENCVSRMTGTEWANISTIARIKSMLMRKRSSRLSGLVQANCE